MKKQKRSHRALNKSTRSNQKSGRGDDVSSDRRGFLKLARNVAIGAGIVGGGGYVFAQNVISTMNEHDLSRVENGVPTIVQVHDPNCSMCLALQRETRKALDLFDDGQLDYVIANIKSSKGRAFANRYGVQHVTLLLFNGEGELQDILQGQRGSHQLRAAFANLLAG